MTIDKQDKSEAVIHLGKDLNIHNSAELKEKVQRLFADGYRRVTLDFSCSTMIDASGLGKILVLQRKFREEEGELRITNVTNKYVQRVFDVVQLQKVINID